MNPNLNQRQASDPTSSVWVAASAGTGKTKVLTDRVLNLLLEGAKPEKILCLTFTKAAASEMANRINQKLGNWSLLSDEKLRQEIEELTGTYPDNSKVSHAKSLFNSVLDNSTGLRISTIHSFCQTILRKFPIEAGIVPYFSVIDDLESRDLIAQSLDLVFQTNDILINDCLKQVSHHYDEGGLEETLSYLISSRQKLDWLNEWDIEKIKSYLNNLFAVNIEVSVEEFITIHMHDVAPELLQVGKAMLGGSPTDEQKGEAIIRFIQDKESRYLNFNDYRAAFLTSNFEIRKTIATKKVLSANPTLEEIINTEALRLYDLAQSINALSNARTSYALILITKNILGHYQNLKTQRAILDYDDLITLTAKLMTNADISPWILFKLDGGIDHILVDEAQDTNNKQWGIVSAITSEFFSGHGARENNRTLFVVGDEKQSIYSFQGANPQIFNQMKGFFSKSVEDSSKTWREINLGVSFRSTTAVLELVDKVFTNPEIGKCISNGENTIQHESFRVGHGGHVEIWPLAINELKEQTNLWDPVEEDPDNYIAPHMILAEKIAKTIKGWIDNKKILPSKGRPIKPSDVMILVQRRSNFSHNLIKVLHDYGVPVSGSDRLLLNEELAIMDLIAAAKFVLQPFDDLNLATLLRTPLIGISEEQLFKLCYGRSGRLWNVIDGDIRQKLQYLKDLYTSISIYGFFTTILNELHGRQLLKSRLGYEIEDPINEFLELIINYESKNTSSLSHFINWFEANRIEIKRDIDQSTRDQVQILTVHGSKGLQAPIIFMPDTAYVPAYKERILWHREFIDSLPLHKAPIAELDQLSAKLLNNAQGAVLQEYYRLLYVALTRAEDQLYICGWKGSREINDGCWYNVIKSALQDIGEEIKDFEEGEHWQGIGYVHQNFQLLEVKPYEYNNISKAHCDLPNWVGEKVATSFVATKVNPSNPEIAIDSDAIERGIIIHKLLQICPQIEQGSRSKYIKQYMEKTKFSEIEKTEIHDEVTSIFSEFENLFGTNSYSEVPIKGKLGNYDFAGQIDRMIINTGEILIVDYKTTPNIPGTAAEISQKVLKQMAYYKRAICEMYPGHNVNCAILWTNVTQLMMIPNSIMENL